MLWRDVGERAQLPDWQQRSLELVVMVSIMIVLVTMAVLVLLVESWLQRLLVVLLLLPLVALLLPLARHRR